MLSITGKQLIAGVPQAEASTTFTGVDPRTKTERPPTFHNATAAEIDAAVQAAQVAFAWIRAQPATVLAGLLDAIADEINALGDQLLETADQETGLGSVRLTGERGRTTGQLRAFAELLREGSYVEAIIDRAQPQRTPAPRPDIRRMLVPLGPVAVFAASNFPFAFSVAGGDTASALAAGCPVIVKAHPGHPATSELVAQAINKAVSAKGFPLGTFSLLQGSDPQVGQTLVKHAGIAAVGFTGSLRAGRAIFDTASARPVPIPVYAEMGSVNPVVILPSALAARAEVLAEGLANSVTLGSGQFCTNPGLIFIEKSAAATTFVQTVVSKLAAKPPTVLLNQQIESGLIRAVEATKTHPHVELLVGGTPINGEAYCYANTAMQTTAAAFRADPRLQTEHFGPVTLFVLCEDRADLLATLDHLEGNLTATIHAETTDLDGAGEVAARLQEKVGRLIWNGFPTGVEVVYAQQHGGPYPATTAPATTSVGLSAIKRFMRPVAFQAMPEPLLPAALQAANPLGILRIVDNSYTRDAL